MQVYVDSEIGHLRSVLLGSIKHFQLHPPINETQRYYYHSDPPRLQVLIEQQARFVETLEVHGVEVYWALSQLESPNQINTRDVATVVGSTLIVCSMKEALRQNEPKALESVLGSLQGTIMHVDGGIVEGGDIILDGRTLYVGISERTDLSGLEWLKQNFGDRFDIHTLQLRPPFLHLDVVFNLVGCKIALIYPPALQAASLEALSKRYKLIEVTQNEQFSLAINVLSLSPETVISDKRYARVNALLIEEALEVIELDYSEITKLGGSFRCSTCPLRRE